ncbi:unnamed protein product [Phytophthora lilii]|uniref:Unnamed protein product n=1 Tax=Phytophthora lilii TaxID=2077276 RepID=A0A9W6TFR0_9STRA|nr:unnamed protein product [Phytophthora lilii]
MRCPVAYHARCLPPGCVRQISSKLIICPKHAAEKPAADADRAKAAPPPKQLTELQEEEKEDDAMSEASAVSASSTRKKEKREKRDKKDKKKKKKKKRKDKHKRESLASQLDDDEHRDRDAEGGKKRKRSKRESIEAEATASASANRSDKGSPSTPSSRTEPKAEVVATPSSPAAGTTDAGASRSPTASFALFESPATATKRIQQRLVEALGQSDDDSDVSTSSPSFKKKRSSSQITGSEGDVASAADSATQEAATAVVKEEQPAGVPSKVEHVAAKDSTKSPVPSSPVPASPAGDKDSLDARSSAEEEAPGPDQKQVRQEERSESTVIVHAGQSEQVEGALKLKIPTSPSASVLIPSSSSAAVAGLVLKHVPSEDEDDDDDAGGSATPGTDATPRTPRGGRAISQGKKKRKSKGKRESQRVLKRETSEEEEEEGNEAKWVQCDSCKKWRTVPRDFNLDAMPKHWYCNMNTWDERYASCTVAEEVLKVNPSPQVDKRRKKLKAKSRSTVSSTGDEGGYSSSGSGPLKRSGGFLKGSVTDMTALEDKEKSSRSKSKDKASKKRKITKQLKEKYGEVKWVQCESTQCGKWRVVPASINFDRLPAVWYCHLNTWAPELAKCSAPNPPEVDAFLLKQAKKEGSARPSKKARATSSAGDAAPAASVSVGSLGGMTPNSSANDLASIGKSNSTKHGKGSKATVSGTGTGASNTGGGNAEGATNSNNSESNNSSGHSTKGRGGRAHNSGSGNTNTSGIKKTVLEWAQCEKCNKWRKLPQHIKSSTLPDKWYCSMNHWDPSHAKCSVPEEADQEPLPLPPHPGSQWHKGGHKGQRPRRGKLSYSELLYGSTGQLRKAYTPESSTLSFDYEGTTYHRDDQYKHSSMYVSPAAMAAAATMAGWSGSDRVSRETSCSNGVPNGDGKVDALAAATPAQASVDQVAALVLKNMDLRRRRSVSELFDAVNSAQRGTDASAAETGASALASLAVVTAALGQLEHRGLVEKVDEFSDEGDEDKPSRKRRRTEALFNGAFAVPTHYRKVPTRPLKASKCWKFGANVVALSSVNDS